MRLSTELFDAIGVAVTALATVLLAIATILLAKATNRLSAISADLKSTQHSAALTQALNALNVVVLSSNENLMTADALLVQSGQDRSPEKIRERWLCFLILNVQALIFASRDQDRQFAELWSAVQRGVLDPLLRNEVVMQLLRTRGYTQEFVDYCEARRQQLLDGRVPIPVPGGADRSR